MNRLSLLLAITYLQGVGFAASPNLVPYTQVQEKEVKSFISIGMDAKQVVAKFGTPNLIDTGTTGEEVWEYLVDPRVVREKNSGYAGFEVFLKFKKVTYVGIIYSNIHHKEE